MKNIYNTYDVINKSGINFGTSGARGLVTDFTPKFAQHLPFLFDSNAAKILIYNGCARN